MAESRYKELLDVLRGTQFGYKSTSRTHAKLDEAIAVITTTEESIKALEAIIKIHEVTIAYQKDEMAALEQDIAELKEEIVMLAERDAGPSL